MASKGSILNGLMEKIVLKALSRLTYSATGELRVSNTPSGTQAVSGTVTATVASTTIGIMTASGASQSTSQSNLQMGFRRNLTVS